MSVISDLQSWPRSGTEVHFTDARRVQPHSEMTTVETVFMGASEINVQKHLSPLLYKSHFLNSDRHKFLSELNAGSPGWFHQSRLQEALAFWFKTGGKGVNIAHATFSPHQMRGCWEHWNGPRGWQNIANAPAQRAALQKARHAPFCLIAKPFTTFSGSSGEASPLSTFHLNLVRPVNFLERWFDS